MLKKVSLLKAMVVTAVAFCIIGALFGVTLLLSRNNHSPDGMINNQFSDEIADMNAVYGLKELIADKDAYIAENYAGNSGCIAINSVSALQEWLRAPNNNGKNAYLTSNIEGFSWVNNFVASGEAVITTNKTLDGCGYTIQLNPKGSGISFDDNYLGLFVGLMENGAVIKNVNFVTNNNELILNEANVKVGMIAGSISSSASNLAGIINCNITNNLSLTINGDSSSKVYYGNIAGEFKGKVDGVTVTVAKNAKTKVTSFAEVFIGGMIGYVMASTSYNVLDVKNSSVSDYSVGGIESVSCGTVNTAYGVAYIFNKETNGSYRTVGHIENFAINSNGNYEKYQFYYIAHADVISNLNNIIVANSIGVEKLYNSTNAVSYNYIANNFVVAEYLNGNIVIKHKENDGASLLLAVWMSVSGEITNNAIDGKVLIPSDQIVVRSEIVCEFASVKTYFVGIANFNKVYDGLVYNLDIVVFDKSGNKVSDSNVVGLILQEVDWICNEITVENIVNHGNYNIQITNELGVVFDGYINSEKHVIKLAESISLNNKSYSGNAIVTINKREVVAHETNILDNNNIYDNASVYFAGLIADDKIDLNGTKIGVNTVYEFTVAGTYSPQVMNNNYFIDDREYIIAPKSINITSAYDMFVDIDVVGDNQNVDIVENTIVVNSKIDELTINIKCLLQGHVYNGIAANGGELEIVDESGNDVLCKLTDIGNYSSIELAKSNPINLSLKVMSSDTTMGTVEYIDTLLPYGSSVTIKATPNQNFQFDSWKINGVVKSYKAEYTFALLSDSIVTAQFYSNPQEACVKIVYHGIGGVKDIIGTQYVCEYNEEAAKNYNYTRSELFKTFVEWTPSVINPKEIHFYPIFDTPNENKYTVTIMNNGAVINKFNNIPFNDSITLNSNKDSFVGWAINGKIVSREKLYSFAVMGDVIVEEVTVVFDEVASNGSLKSHNSDGYLWFYGNNFISTGVVKSGIILISGSVSDAEVTIENTNALVAAFSGVAKGNMLQFIAKLPVIVLKSLKLDNIKMRAYTTCVVGGVTRNFYTNIIVVDVKALL